MEYSEKFKADMLKKLLPPTRKSACSLAEETGVSQGTLSRWLREASSVRGMSQDSKKKWSAAEKLRVIMAASALDGERLGELLRREGLHQANLDQWRAAAESGLADAPRGHRPSVETQRIKELERELRRKDRALAEVSALLVLKKKVDALWGDEDDETKEGNGR